MKPKLNVKKPDKDKPEKQSLVINIDSNSEDDLETEEVVEEAFYVEPIEEPHPSILFRIQSGAKSKNKTCCWILVAWTLVASLAAGCFKINLNL